MRARRDPAARRAEIVRAAADLILEVGTGRVTHRMVAQRASVPLGSTTQYFATLDDLRAEALEVLVRETEDGLDEVRAECTDIVGEPERLARLLHRYLDEARNVRADVALFSTAAYEPDLRALALRWFTGLVDILAAQVGKEKAVALAVFADGASVHAVLHDEPLSVESLTRTISALTGGVAPNDERS